MTAILAIAMVSALLAWGHALAQLRAAHLEVERLRGRLSRLGHAHERLAIMHAEAVDQLADAGMHGRPGVRRLRAVRRIEA